MVHRELTETFGDCVSFFNLFPNNSPSYLVFFSFIRIRTCIRITVPDVPKCLPRQWQRPSYWNVHKSFQTMSRMAKANSSTPAKVFRRERGRRLIVSQNGQKGDRIDAGTHVGFKHLMHARMGDCECSMLRAQFETQIGNVDYSPCQQPSVLECAFIVQHVKVLGGITCATNQAHAPKAERGALEGGQPGLAFPGFMASPGT